MVEVPDWRHVTHSARAAHFLRARELRVVGILGGRAASPQLVVEQAAPSAHAQWVGGACEERGQTRRRVGGSAHMRSMVLSEVSASNFTCASSSSWITIHAAEVNSGTLTSITGCRQATHFSDGRGLHLHTSDSGQRGMPREYMPAFVPYGLGCMRLALVASPIRRRPTRSNDDGLTTRSESKSSRCVNGRTKLGVSTRAQKSVLNPGTNELARCGCWATTPH